MSTRAFNNSISPDELDAVLEKNQFKTKHVFWPLTGLFNKFLDVKCFLDVQVSKV